MCFTLICLFETSFFTFNIHGFLLNLTLCLYRDWFDLIVSLIFSIGAIVFEVIHADYKPDAADKNQHKWEEVNCDGWN